MGCRPGRAYQFKFLDTKPLKDYATDRAAVSTSRSFSAASFFQCLAIRSKNFRSSALLAFEAYTRIDEHSQRIQQSSLPLHSR